MSLPYPAAAFAAVALLAFAGRARAEGPEPTVTVHFEGNRRSLLVSGASDAPDSWTPICSRTCTTDLTPGGTFRILRNGHPSPPFTLQGRDGDHVSLGGHVSPLFILGWVTSGLGLGSTLVGLALTVMPVLMVGDNGKPRPADPMPFAVGSAVGLPLLAGGLIMMATNQEPGVSQRVAAPRADDDDDDHIRTRRERRRHEEEFSPAAWVLPVFGGHF